MNTRRLAKVLSVVQLCFELATDLLQPGADGRMVKEMKTNLPASIVKAPVAGPARRTAG